MSNRDHVVSIRLSDEEHAHLEQLVQVHGEDRSALLRRLVLSAPLWSVRMLPTTPTTTDTVASPRLDDLVRQLLAAQSRQWAKILREARDG